MKQSVLTVSVAPFWHSSAGVARSSYITMAALVPAVLAGVYHYKVGALAVIGLSMGICMLSEALMQKLMGQPVTLRDGTAALTGLLLALLLPAGVPWWLVAVGAVSAIVLGKQIYGGLGSHPLSATLVGWLIIRVSWSVHMDADASLLNLANLKGLSPLAALQGGYVDHVGLMDLCMGNVIGAIGSAGLLVFLGGVVLAGLKVIKWEIPVAFLLGVVLSSFWLADQMLPEGSTASISVLTMLFTGPVMLGAFFLATDAPSSPSQPAGKWIYGFAAGFLAMIIQVKGNYYDSGVVFGIFLMSFTTPLLDKIRPKARGRE